MKKIVACHVIALVVAVWPVTAMAQNLTPRRSIAFAQIVAGGGFDSLINLTNRGTNTYTGTLYLFKSSAVNQPWTSAVINGTAVTNGAYFFTITAGNTITLDITSSALSAGFGQVTPADTSASALLDGTLTYYIKSGTSVTDSVGVLPSSELMITTIPFDNFNTIALGLVNLNSFATTLHLKLYSDANPTPVATINRTFQSMEQVSQYLSQFFPLVTNIIKGRLDIQGDNYFIGTALTQQPAASGATIGQYSSLPFLPAAKTYTYVRTSTTQPTMTGELYLFVEEMSYQGYVRDLTSGGSPVNNPMSYIQGHMISDPNGNPALTVYNTGTSQGQEYILYIIIDPFSLSMSTLTGVWYGIVTTPGYLGSVGTVGAQGTMTMTATN